MKYIYAWMRTNMQAGDYPADTGESAYIDNATAINAVIVPYGGNLLNDGTWYQDDWRLSQGIASTISSMAAANGHLYLPMVGCSPSIMPTILDNPAIQTTAADNLIALATTRFDAPWDGVVLDFEGIPSTYKDKLSQFLLLLSYKLRSNGLQCHIWTRGKVSDPGVDYDDAYSYDFSVVAQAADMVHLGCYGYWKPVPRSLAPHWWIDGCIQYALAQRIPVQNLLLSIPFYSRYRPDVSANTGYDITYTQAVQIAHDNNEIIEWIESSENGLVRERYADVGAGEVWIQDGDTLRHSLDLVDRYNLAGISPFVVGTESPDVWDVINNWKNGA